MIEINLLPEDLKIKTRGKSPEQPGVKNPLAQVQDQVFIYAIPALLGLLILIHLYFGVISVSKNAQLAALNRKWLDLAGQKKAMDEFNQDAAGQNGQVLRQLNLQRVVWAQKLNALSLHLPSGIWFNEIILSNYNFTIRGSVISLQKEEVTLINKLLDNLKTTPEFSRDFSGFELNNVQKRSLGGYDVADFVLVGALKTK